MHTNKVECGQVETYERLTSTFVSSASQIHFSMREIQNPNLGEEAGFAARRGHIAEIMVTSALWTNKTAMGTET